MSTEVNFDTHRKCEIEWRHMVSFYELHFLTFFIDINEHRSQFWHTSDLWNRLTSHGEFSWVFIEWEWDNFFDKCTYRLQDVYYSKFEIHLAYQKSKKMTIRNLKIVWQNTKKCTKYYWWKKRQNLISHFVKLYKYGEMSFLISSV